MTEHPAAPTEALRGSARQRLRNDLRDIRDTSTDGWARTKADTLLRVVLDHALWHGDEPRTDNEAAERLMERIRAFHPADAIWIAQEDLEAALAAARAAARKEVLDEIRETALAFWSDESIERNYAFHPNLLWSWLDSLSTDTREEPTDGS